MTAKDEAFEAWMLSDLEAVASVIRARGEQNAEIVRTALRKAWDAGREAEREACANMCEVNAQRWPDARKVYVAHECAAAIRARGSQ